jgi:hypothetical protein
MWPSIGTAAEAMDAAGKFATASLHFKLSDGPTRRRGCAAEKRGETAASSFASSARQNNDRSYFR